MTFKAGIVGAGGIAGMGILGMHDEEEIGEKKFQASHAGGYEASEKIDLVAIADVDEEKMARFGEAWGIPEDKRYLGHEHMIETEDLDVVSVCTPSYLHRDPVVDIASTENAPRVIWCEKPIASKVADAEEMIAVCDENAVELVVNHSFRFTDKLRQLRKLLLDRQLLGEVHSVSSQFRMELMRNSTHLLDMLVYLLDSRAERVSGHITGEHEATEALGADRSVDDSGGGGFVVMDDGTFTTIDCTIPRDASSMNLQILGSEGKLYLNNDDGEWRYWTLEDGDHVEQDLPGIEGAWTWETDYRQAFPNAAMHIERMLEGEASNPSTGREAIRSLEIIIAFYISEYTTSQVTLPLEEPLRDIEITSW